MPLLLLFNPREQTSYQSESVWRIALKHLFQLEFCIKDRVYLQQVLDISHLLRDGGGTCPEVIANVCSGNLHPIFLAKQEVDAANGIHRSGCPNLYFS